MRNKGPLKSSAALKRCRNLKLHIGVKYCGGCNPEYDRAALVKKIQEKLKDKADFYSWEEEDIDLVLVVCGCGVSCVDLSPFSRFKTQTIKNPEDVDFFAQGDLKNGEKL